MDCFTGASSGALKGVCFSDGTFKNINSINELNAKCDEITSMCWSGASDQTEVLTAQMDRHLRLYDTVNDKRSSLFKVDGGTGPVKGLHVTNGGSSIVTAVESGEVCVWNEEGAKLSELNAGSDLLVMTNNSIHNQQYATGGIENPLKVWDIEHGQKIFTAKNVRPDNLQLRVPIWDTDIRFMNESQNIVTTTGKHQIRVYDPRSQRRPVKEMEWLEEPITAMTLCNSQMHIVAGNSKGEMALFDLRNKLRVVCKLKGCSGSVRGIDAHPASPLVASCSIDRFVRLHDFNSKKLIKKVYCKARLNKLLMKNDISIMDKREKVNKEELDEYDETWRKIEEGGEVGDNSDDFEASMSSEDETLWNDMRERVQHGQKRKKNKLNDHGDERVLAKKGKTDDRNKRKFASENENVDVKRNKKEGSVQVSEDIIAKSTALNQSSEKTRSNSSKRFADNNWIDTEHESKRFHKDV
ncbi:unnamed protein product [Anisakis simplex]|uniref:WD_REPEATS_REGION domain-containing protein n=1 Tax=Anisakis simplex TaxID=6269 RepID=A0A0M3K106_ANISI|nr:unnamed protein product [Anisakis simplex]